jgi:uncharacterized RmlC-like cupin family protein
MNWRTEGVVIVRADAAARERVAAGGKGRMTAFEFTGSGGHQTWIGTVTLQPNAQTGTHHHGRHEVAVYGAKGRSEIRWGERLEFRAEVGSGDFVYFTPYVPHQERNLSADDLLEFVVVRSDSERLAIKLDTVPVEQPETVFQATPPGFSAIE